LVFTPAPMHGIDAASIRTAMHLTVDHANGRGLLLAYQMNGAPLRRHHGYPLPSWCPLVRWHTSSAGRHERLTGGRSPGTSMLCRTGLRQRPG